MDKGAGIKGFSATYMKGATVMYWKSAVGYSALFVVNKISNDFSPNNSSGYWTVPASAAVTSAIKVTITNPLDVIKTHRQAAGSKDGVSMLKTAKDLYKANGSGVFFTGVLPRYVHGFIASATGIMIMKMSDELDRQTLVSKSAKP